MPTSRATPQHDNIGLYSDGAARASTVGRHVGVNGQPQKAKSKRQATRIGACEPVLAGKKAASLESFHKEEALWMARQQMTGAVARMVVYAQGERPMDDILSLQRTPHGHLMVMAMLLDGPAAMAGVARGDVLVSINGRRPPVRAQEDKILVSLRGPVTLVFLGFVGKIQAEVQVAQPDAPSCGLPESVDLVVPPSPATNILQRETV
eukprot:3759217-Amphidinium_carterae.1